MTQLEQINALIEDGKKDSPDFTDMISDGYHTFKELYHHRCVLTAALFRQAPFTWKSKFHDDPENNPMYDDMFIVGVTTPDGQATYHYNMKYWDLFKVPEIPHAPKFDGHTPEDAITRIGKYFARGILIYNEKELDKIQPHLEDVLNTFDSQEAADTYMRIFIKEN